MKKQRGHRGLSVKFVLAGLCLVLFLGVNLALNAGLNRDAEVDIIVGNLGEQNSIYFGQEFVTATAESVGPGAENTSAVAVGDFDGDGNLDIVEINFNGQDILFWGDGTGAFNNFTSFGAATGDTSVCVVTGDFNGDSFQDIAVGHNNGQNEIYLSSGATRGLQATPVQFGTGSDLTLALASADVDSDGDIDIIAGNNGQNVVYFNDGATPPSFAISQTFGTGSDNTWALALGDADDDGDLDVYVGNNAEQDLIYANNGTGNFNTQLGSFGNATTPTTALAVGDFDSDSIWDVAAAYNDTTGTNSNHVFWGTGGASGDFANVTHDFGTGSDATWAVIALTIDAVAGLDLAYGNNGEQDFWAQGPNARANFTTTTAFGNAAHTTTSLGHGDFDEDGNVDLVVGSSTLSTIVLTGDGAGNFGAGGTITVGTGADDTWTLALGDLNDDIFPDIFVGNDGQDVIYFGDGDGTFDSNSLTIGGATDTRASFIADVDGDNDLDIVTGRDQEQNVIYLNDGSGTFSTTINFGTGSDATYALDYQDMNDDNFKDILVGNFNGQNVIYYGTSTGGFTASTNFGTGTDATEGVAAADLNGDGFKDIVVANFNAQDVIYFRTTGGSWTSSQDLGGTTSQSRDVKIANIDEFLGNFLADIVMGFDANANAIVYNDENASFTSTRSWGAAAGQTQSVIAVDFNFDGRLDLAEGNDTEQNATYMDVGNGSFDASTSTITTTNFGPGTDATKIIIHAPRVVGARLKSGGGAFCFLGVNQGHSMNLWWLGFVMLGLGILVKRP